jgi:hypothetical protein
VEIKQVSRSDLKSFLVQDHTSFSVLSVSTKHIESTDRISVTLSKNSARSFYLGKEPAKSVAASLQPNKLPDDCCQDAQNCTYFAFFNSKEKKLYTRFKDNFEANFFCSCSPQECPHQHLFLTGTYNTSLANHYAWTTNWDTNDPCWETFQDKSWLKDWATKFDPQAEPLKVLLPPVPEDATQFITIKKHFAQLIKDINRIFKPTHWKWVVVFELQKNGNWHWHLFSTSFIPYSHKCVLNQQQTKACWNCRTYLNKLWTYGRVESRSLNKQAAGQYLAKYLSKSFHLRSLYAQHGLKDKHRAYHFYQNLYDYESRAVSFNGKSKIDQLTGTKLNGNQTVFRHYDYQTHETSYYYKTNRKLVGKCARPIIIKKNYRLGTRSLNTLNLLNLATKHKRKEAYLFSEKKTYQQDFQEFLITRLLLLCKSAEFTHLPLEQEQVPKELTKCDQSITNHFQTKPVLHFSFEPENATVVRSFIENLDTYASEYDMEESQEFYAYPVIHDAKHKITKQQQGLCGCEMRARNQYLDNWTMNYCYG